MRRCLFLVYSLVVALSMGCGAPPRPSGVRTLAPAGTPYTTNYIAGAVYRLRKPVLLAKWPPGSGAELVSNWRLFEENTPMDFLPISIEDYRRDGPARWPAVLAVLPAGTELEFREVRITRSDLMGEWIYALGVVREGPGSSVGLVDLTAVSSRPSTPTLTVNFDPVELELVDKRP